MELFSFILAIFGQSCSSASLTLPFKPRQPHHSSQGLLRRAPAFRLPMKKGRNNTDKSTNCTCPNKFEQWELKPWAFGCKEDWIPTSYQAWNTWGSVFRLQCTGFLVRAGGVKNLKEADYYIDLDWRPWAAWGRLPETKKSRDYCNPSH